MPARAAKSKAEAAMKEAEDSFNSASEDDAHMDNASDASVEELPKKRAPAKKAEKNGNGKAAPKAAAKGKAAKKAAPVVTPKEDSEEEDEKVKDEVEPEAPAAEAAAADVASEPSDAESEDDEPKNKKKKAAPAAAKNGAGSSSDDKEERFELGKMKFISVSTFKGKQYVNIREYYAGKNGVEMPGKKGIALDVDAWKKLKTVVSKVDALIN